LFTMVDQASLISVTVQKAPRENEHDSTNLVFRFSVFCTRLLI
jgi:hypothetical protein